MKKILVTTAILLAIVLFFGAAMYALDLYTGPIIEKNNAGAAAGELLEVLPEGAAFEELNIAELGLPEAILKAHKETSGKGFVFEVKSAGYGPDMIVRVGVDAEGKITGSKCIQTNDTFKKEPELDNKYNGQTLETFAPVLIGGATMTSNGYRDAVSNALQAFVLLSGGELGDDVILEGLLPTVAPSIVNPKAVENVSGNITKAYKAANDAGFAYIISAGDSSFLAVVNATGACKVYDVEGNDVTSANAAVVDEAKAHAAANQVSYLEAFKTEIGKLMDGAAEFAPIEIDVFNTVVSAVSFTVDGATYYGFYSRVIGFDQMDVYIIIDENGAIAKLDAKEFIFLEDDFEEYGTSGYEGMPDNYTGNFEGVTGDTWSDDIALITGATKTTDAVKAATKDAFAAFNSIKGGNN